MVSEGEDPWWRSKGMTAGMAESLHLCLQAGSRETTLGIVQVFYCAYFCIDRWFTYMVCLWEGFDWYGMCMSCVHMWHVCVWHVCLHISGIFCVCVYVHLCGLWMVCGMAWIWCVSEVSTRCMYLACGPVWVFQESHEGDHSNQEKARVFKEPYPDQFVLFYPDCPSFLWPLVFHSDIMRIPRQPVILTGLRVWSWLGAKPWPSWIKQGDRRMRYWVLWQAWKLSCSDLGDPSGGMTAFQTDEKYGHVWLAVVASSCFSSLVFSEDTCSNSYISLCGLETLGNTVS